MDKVKEILNKYNITKEKPLIISVSGGVDSMVLLDYLYNENYPLYIVHFNHHTRITNLNDEETVINYAEARNLRYQIININISNGNFQETARKMRYYNLRQIARKHRTPFILTAHHLDDLAETILIKLTRGSNLYGYAGIHPGYERDGFIYLKPLLYTSKDVIIAYAKENNVPYLDDITNFETTYLRNRYRHAIIPILKQENEQFLEQVKKYHMQLAKAARFIRNYSSNFITKDNKIIIDKLLLEDDYIIENVVALLLEDAKVNFTYETNLKLVELLKSDEPNLSYDLSHQRVFIKAYNEAFIMIKSIKKEIDQKLTFGENVLQNMKIVTLLKNKDSKDKNLNELCYNKLKFPLIVRNRKNGDITTFNYGTKKLKDLLIDLKVPKYLRDDLLVITDSNDTILWIPGVYLNETLGEKNKLYLKIGEKK